MAPDKQEIIAADSASGTYQTTYSYPNEPPSVAIPTAIMELIDGDVTDLDPLYTSTEVNTDALDTMFDSPLYGQPDTQVTFTYQGFKVTVKSGGRIVLRVVDGADRT